MTYRYVAYDLLTSLKKLFDDTDIRLPQVLYWIQVVGNDIRKRHFNETETGAFLSTFSAVTVQVDAKGNQYVDLPVQILDLAFDRGIDYITYNHETGCCCTGANWAQVLFQQTKRNIVKRLYDDEYEKPSPQNPYFYRLGGKVDNVKVNRVYFVGTECIKLQDVEMGLITSMSPTDICDLDEEVPLPDELISVLMTEVLQLGRFVTFMPSERINDGSDESKAVVNNVPSIQPQEQQPEEQQ